MIPKPIHKHLSFACFDLQTRDNVERFKRYNKFAMTDNEESDNDKDKYTQ